MSGALRSDRSASSGRSDEGSIFPLVAGFVALALAVTLVLAAASSLYLTRKRLLTVADGAALAAAESFDLASAVVQDGRVRFRLEDDRVERAALAYLAEAPSLERDGFELVEAAGSDALTARVTLRARWRLPLVAALLPDGVPVDVTASARSVLQ